MNIFEELSRANLRVKTRRLKWFCVTDKIIVFYDAFNPCREVRVERKGTLEEQILTARKQLRI